MVTSELPGRPAWDHQNAKINEPQKIFLYFLICTCPASLKFENEAHPGYINLKMMPTLGTSGPQRQVLYCSASKGVNISVGMLSVFFCGHQQK